MTDTPTPNPDETPAETAPEAPAPHPADAPAQPDDGIPAPPPAHKPPYVLLSFAACFIATLVAGLVFYLKTVDHMNAAISGIAKAFSKEEITETFFLHQIEAQSTNGAILEVAKADSLESFSRSSSLKLWDRTLPLGTTVSEITVPATYRYHIDLNNNWNLSVDGDICVVTAPAFQPSLPVAIDTAGMEKKTSSGWARFDGNEILAELESSLTAKLEERALGAGTRAAVREQARQSVAVFVQNWLLRENQWGPEKFTRIVVHFADEKPRPTPDEYPRPTILFSADAG